MRARSESIITSKSDLKKILAALSKLMGRFEEIIVSQPFIRNDELCALCQIYHKHQLQEPSIKVHNEAKVSK